MAPSPTPSPYKFLDPYDIADRGRFFGRDRETRLLLADVIARRLVLLFAKSGTGKTSLINAGVRPVLEQRDYATYYVRVRRDPVVSAREVLAADSRARLPADGSFAEQLVAVVTALDQPIVVFFDQFEEFFLYQMKDDPDRASAFIGDVADVYRDRGSGVHLVFSMREEFFVEMDAFHDAIPTVFEKDSHLRLRWFDASQAREAIALPAAAAGAKPDARLVDRLIADLSLDGRIEPAQLQIVCHTLWRGDGLIALDEYRRRADSAPEGNPARQILDQRLGEAFARLEHRSELDALERLLPALRTARGTKYVRDLDGLIAELGVHEDVLRPVLTMLRDARLVITHRRDDLEYVELTHDYLVERLDQLAAHAGTLWPRRVLRAELDRYAAAGSGWEPGADLHDVVERVRLELQRARRVGAPAPGDLRLDRDEAELLFAYSLQRGLYGAEMLVLALEHGVPAWEILEARIDGADPGAAAAALDALAGAESPRAVDMLGRALGRADLSPRALDALTALANSGDRPEIASRAAALALDHLGTVLDDPQRVASAIPSVGAIHDTGAVEVLGRLVADARQRVAAETALLALVDSTRTSVAETARRALLRHWRRALVEGGADPETVQKFGRVHDAETVELLELAATRPHLREAADKACLQLEGAPDALIAAEAARLRARLASVPPPPPPAPVPRADRRVPGRGEPSPDDVPMEAQRRRVARALMRGDVVPVIGPGANLSGRPGGAAWQRGTHPPTGHELASYLADGYGYPLNDRSLAGVAQWVQVVVGRRVLARELHGVYAAEYLVPPVHRTLADLPDMLRRTGSGHPHMLVFTTNFDDMLERAYVERGEPVDVLTYLSGAPAPGRFAHRSPSGDVAVVDDPLEYMEISRESNSVIVKLLGGIDREDADRDSYVITEDDHVEYLVRWADPLLPAPLVADLRRSHLLFLGISLEHWTSRATLHALWRLMRRQYRSWAIQHPGAGRYAGDIWSERGVELIEAELDDYVLGLAAGVAEPQ